MGSRDDSILWQNTLNNLQGMAMRYGQLKQRDQQMKIESAQQLWNVGNGIYQAAKSPEAKKMALERYVSPAIQTLNQVYGWNLPMDKLGDVVNRADDKTVGTALKELDALNKDITKGAIPMDQGVGMVRDKLASYVDYFNKDDYAAINEKGTGLLKNLETLQKRDKQFSLIESQLKTEQEKALAKLYIENDDDAGLRGLLSPTKKTSLVPLYGPGGAVIYDEMGAGDKVPEGYSPRPPKAPREKDPDIAVEKQYRKVHGNVSANLRRNTQNRAITAKLLETEIKTNGNQTQRALNLQQKLNAFDEQIGIATNTLAQLENGEIEPSAVRFGGAKKTTQTKHPLSGQKPGVYKVDGKIIRWDGSKELP